MCSIVLYTHIRVLYGNRAIFFPGGVMDEYWQSPVDEYRIAMYEFVRERTGLILYGIRGYILCNDDVVGIGKGRLC